MPNAEKLAKKQKYFDKLTNLVETCPTALIVGVDFVGSLQMQQIRTSLRGKCQVLMGKNTMIRTALRKRIEVTEDEKLQTLLENVNGNMGFIFCHKPSSLQSARAAIGEFVVPAAAKAGAVAQADVYIPAGPTGLEPSQTSFFQALNIPTKIVKGVIEITTDCRVCEKEVKVSLSAQALLTKMGIRPFEYGMGIIAAYQNYEVFPAAVLDIDDSVLIPKFLNGVSHVAAFGREIGIPTEAGLPHMMIGAFKNIVATVVDFDFDAGEKVNEIKAILSDPEALAKMQAAAAGPAAGAGAGGSAPAAAAAAPVEEEEEEEADFDLFG